MASGLSQQRRGLARVLKLAERGGYTKLLIEYPDRLAGFGYLYIESHLRYCCVEIIVIPEKEPADSQSELVKDLLSIVTPFFSFYKPDSLTILQKSSSQTWIQE